MNAQMHIVLTADGVVVKISYCVFCSFRVTDIHILVVAGIYVCQAVLVEDMHESM